MNSILIASRDKTTCEELFQKLRPEYKLTLLRPSQDLSSGNLVHKVTILDSRYTSKNGFDALLRIRAASTAPVIYLVPQDSPSLAIEAIKHGVCNYILKTSNYLDFLPGLIELELSQYKEMQVLKLANKKLVSHLKSSEALKNNPTAQAEPPVAETTSEQGGDVTLIQKIKAQIKAGEVNLPSIPDMIQKINKLVEEHASISELSALIQNDAVISMGLIRISNTSRYKGVTENRDLDQAINRLGIEQSMVFVQMISNRSLYASQDKMLSAIFGRLWKHSQACACVSQIIAQKVDNGNGAEVFMMGLLHDIGALFLLQVISEIRARGDEADLKSEDLLEILGDYHESFGRSLLKNWRFSADYIDIATNHEQVEKQAKPSQNLRIVSLADRMVKSLGYVYRTDVEEFQCLETDQLLGVNEELLEEIFDESKQALEELD